MLRSPRSRRIRRAFLAGGALSAFLLGWYALNRAASPWRAVKLLSLAAGPKPGAGSAPGELRIGVYNIAHGRGPGTSNWAGGGREVRLARLREIARLLADQKLDLVVLNEVDFDSAWSGGIDQAEVIAREAGFPCRAEGRSFDVSLPFFRLRFGSAVLSRFPIVEAGLVRFPAYSALESLAAGKKSGLLCTIRLPGEGRVRLLAVHLEHRSEAVRVSSARVIERLRAESALPLIAAGDFNSAPLGYPGATPDPQGRTALSLLLAGGGFRAAVRERPGPGDLTFPSTGPRTAIDWILVPAGWRLAEQRVLDSKLSDHRPVVARVILGK